MPTITLDYKKSLVGSLGFGKKDPQPYATYLSLVEFIAHTVLSKDPVIGKVLSDEFGEKDIGEKDTSDQAASIQKILFELNNIEKQNNFLTAVARALGYKKIQYFCETYSKDAGSITYYQHQRELDVNIDFEKIKPKNHSGLNYLLDISENHYRSENPNQGLPYSGYVGYMSFIKRFNKKLEVISPFIGPMELMDISAGDLIDKIWVDAEKYMNSLQIADISLDTLMLHIDPVKKEASCNFSGPSKGFKNHKFDVTGEFLGVERRFANFKNGVIVR